MPYRRWVRRARREFPRNREFQINSIAADPASRAVVAKVSSTRSVPTSSRAALPAGAEGRSVPGRSPRKQELPSLRQPTLSKWLATLSKWLATPSKWLPNPTKWLPAMQSSTKS